MCSVPVVIEEGCALLRAASRVRIQKDTTKHSGPEGRMIEVDSRIQDQDRLAEAKVVQAPQRVHSESGHGIDDVGLLRLVQSYFRNSWILLQFSDGRSWQVDPHYIQRVHVAD